MKPRLALIAAILAMGWAVARTGVQEDLAKRFQAKSPKPVVRTVSVVGETPEYRLVKHPLGETRVPRTPRRIATLSLGATDSVVALGLRPVLVVSSYQEHRAPVYMTRELEGVPVLPSSGGVNLESLLLAKPDLILIGSQLDNLGTQLSRIAPTVSLGSGWSGACEPRLLDVADAVGRTDRAHALIARFHRRCEEARATLTERAPGQSVVFLRFRRSTCVVYTRTGMFGPLLFNQLGLTPDPVMPLEMLGDGWDVLSLERLSTLTADHIFVVIDRDSEPYFDTVAQTAIWRSLRAVKLDQVHRVAFSTWLSDGILGAEAIVRDVLAAMVPEPAIQNPRKGSE